MTRLMLFAQRGADSPINRWLNENPLVLGIIFLVIGLLLLLSGIYSLRSGVAHDKYGREVRGGVGKALTIVRLIAGVGCCGFALYKIAVGLIA